MPSTKEIIVDPLADNNPITVQMLGICSALAVTVKMSTATVMCLAVIVVMCAASFIISLMRRVIPFKIRIIVQMLVIATLVVLVDEFLKAFMPEQSRMLSVFVALIITNCIVMGRTEGFALQNPPLPSLLDGLGNALGYSLILIIVASLREIFAFGTWFDVSLFGESYMGNGLAGLSPGAFIIIGLIIWVQRTVTKQYKDD